MNVKSYKKLILAATVVILLNFNSCGKYEDGPGFTIISKTARLVGEWEVIEVDNLPQEAGEPKLVLEFEKDGDFSVNIVYVGYSNSYDGEWEWESGKESIEVGLNGGVMEEWDILRLTNDEFWFEDTSDQVFECEKRK